MITIEHELGNPFSQDFYDKLISSIQFHQLSCTCGHCACLIRHGAYLRTVKVGDSLLRLRVCRVRCTHCGSTHALLPSAIIPYSQILLADAAAILECHQQQHSFSPFLECHLPIDENNIKSLISRYRRHWHQRLLAQGIRLLPLSMLVRRCFRFFSRLFLQIKNTKTLLFSPPT